MKLSPADEEPARGRFFSPLLMLLLALAVAPAGAAPRSATADQLDRECDALIHDAVRRPYGWAWDDAATPDQPTVRQPFPPHTVSLQPTDTPAAGVVLLWAGQLLNEPRYVHAAMEAGRAACVATIANGKTASRPLFSATPSFREAPAPVPDRAPNRAAVALLCALLDPTPFPPPPPDAPPATQPNAPESAEQLRSGAFRTAIWLSHQLSPNGFWPTGFPPNATPEQTYRIVRLDDSDYRDCTVALLLAADVLQDPVLNMASRKPLDSLHKVRLAGDAHGPGLWSTAYLITGTDIPPRFPSGPDVLASRYAMQTFLAGYLQSGDHTQGIDLESAAAALTAARLPDGTWSRFLDPITQSMYTKIPVTAEANVFGTTQPAPTTNAVTDPFEVAPFPTGTYGINPTLQTISRLRETGRARYTNLLAANLSLRRQLIATAVGLSDTPFELDLPLSANEVGPYFASHTAALAVTQGPMPDDLAGRVRRLWLLLLRTLAERHAA